MTEIAAEVQSGPTSDGRCPDDGTCHHACKVSCFRVRYCAPLSGVFEGDRWPADARSANAYADETWQL